MHTRANTNARTSISTDSQSQTSAQLAFLFRMGFDLALDSDDYAAYAARLLSAPPSPASPAAPPAAAAAVVVAAAAAVASAAAAEREEGWEGMARGGRLPPMTPRGARAGGRGEQTVYFV